MIAMNSIPLLHETIQQVALLHASDPTVDRASAMLRLRKSLPAVDRETLSLAVDTYFSRSKAIEKLGEWAQHGLFTSELLEQASRQAVSTYRASFFQGLDHVLEIGTGSGSDTAAIARVARHVTSIEVDPIRADLARENLRLQGISNVTVVAGDITETVASLEHSMFDGLFADPARRTRAGKRVRDASDYSPSLDFLLALSIGHVRALKVSPGLFFQPPHSAWRRHFIGVGDECLEQTLVYGVSVADSSVSLADKGVTWEPTAFAPNPLPHPQELAGYLCEAHAVINRSQYLSTFFAERGIAQLAPDVSYGVSPEMPAVSPLLTSFRIVEVGQFSTSTLQRMLTAHSWTTRTEFKKRNCVLDLDAVRTALTLPPHAHQAPFGTVFLFTWRGAHHVVLGERLGG